MERILSKADAAMVTAVDEWVSTIQSRWRVSYAVVQMSAMALAVPMAYAAVVSSFRDMPSAFALATAAFVALSCVAAVHMAKVYWPSRRGMSLEAFYRFWTMSQFNRASPRLRVVLCAVLAGMLLLNAAVLPDLRAAGLLASQSVLAIGPFLVVLYVMCARPLPVLPDGWAKRPKGAMRNTASERESQGSGENQG